MGGCSIVLMVDYWGCLKWSMRLRAGIVIYFMSAIHLASFANHFELEA